MKQVNFEIEDKKVDKKYFDPESSSHGSCGSLDGRNVKQPAIKQVI